MNASEMKILRVTLQRCKMSARDSTPCQNTTNEVRKLLEEVPSCLPVYVVFTRSSNSSLQMIEIFILPDRKMQYTYIQ